MANQFYRIDYTDNQAFKDAIADGHTLEVLFKPEYSGTIADREAKVFASHEAGGTGIMVKTKGSGSNSVNGLTFLPNVSTSGNSTWRWTNSDIVPQNDAYYHVVGVWDKESQKSYIYVNGVLENELDLDGSNYVGPKAGAEKFCIGGDACVVSGDKTTGVQNGINGTVVLARIYDDPLTGEQAQRLYQDVEKGILRTRPLAENVTLLETVQVKAGVSYPIYGTGFQEGDVIMIDNETSRWDLPVALDGTEGVKVTLPADVKGGRYAVTLKRDDRRLRLGVVKFTLVENFDVDPLIVAHRGYWAKEGAAQNSRAALRNAIELKAYGAETDIWLTKDNVLVINHDPSIGGAEIQSSDYAAIKDKTLSNGETLPTLAEYLEILKESDYCKLVIETKTHSTEARTIEAAKAAAEAVRAAGLENKVVYIAFDYATCKALAAAYPQAEVQFLCDRDDQVRNPAQLDADGPISIDYQTGILNKNPSFIKEAHDLGLKVNTWTLRSSAEIGEWINKGADILTTDIPALGMKYLEYYSSNK